ncbi:MAG: 23S rRNA (adenine(2503)-C(2))-methyltransferase RlmN [Lachnospiraceae bacterium]
MEPMDIQSLLPEELEALVLEAGEKKYRAGQLFEWFHKRLVMDYAEMTNLPQPFREKLKAGFPLKNLQMAQVQVSEADGTRKYLFRLFDGNIIESVCMTYHHGNSVCISTQAGCRMGCTFCASTLDGLSRNLLPSEMLAQIYAIQTHTQQRVTNVVVMGTGEPLDNYENLLRFVQLLNHEKGCRISQRNITVSTCGLVPQIRQLAEEGLQITLALSLHAATQAKREVLMPIAKAYNLTEVMEACKEYFAKTGRRMTFEYSLIEGENDSAQDVRELGELLKGLNAHVNLIPINPIKEREYQRPNRQNVEKFKIKLEKYGINVTIRREMGSDIDGACGQLRKRFFEQAESEKPL